MTTQTLDVITSATPDLTGLQLDAEMAIDAADYARIMRRIIGGEDGTGSRVCAFNSSI